MDKAHIQVSLQILSMSSELWLHNHLGSHENPGLEPRPISTSGSKTQAGTFGESQRRSKRPDFLFPVGGAVWSPAEHKLAPSLGAAAPGLNQSTLSQHCQILLSSWSLGKLGRQPQHRVWERSGGTSWPDQGLEDKLTLGLKTWRKQETSLNQWAWDLKVPLPIEFYIVEKVVTEGSVL